MAREAIRGTDGEVCIALKVAANVEAHKDDTISTTTFGKRMRETCEEEEGEQQQHRQEQHGAQILDDHMMTSSSPTMKPVPHPHWKTSLCSYFRRNSASCNHGDNCRYAHGEDELRPKPDNSWDPTSQRANKLLKTQAANEQHSLSTDLRVEDVLGFSDGITPEKCIVGLPITWDSQKFKLFLDEQGILYNTAKKKKGMTLGFLSFTNLEQLHCSVKELNEKSIGGKYIKVADVIHRSTAKGRTEYDYEEEITSALVSSNAVENDDCNNDNTAVKGLGLKIRNARDVVTPLANMPYSEQLEHKKKSLLQSLKKLTRNARKACPSSVPLPEWIQKSRGIGGLPCEFEGILQSPTTSGYRNKCEFSVGYSLNGVKTVGFMLGNFREGMIAVEEPVDCPNVSWISCQYARIFQNFLQSSVFPVWNRINNNGFWRQLTVREGRDPCIASGAENTEVKIAEVMLIIQICSNGVEEDLMNTEFEKMTECLAQGATACSPPLPLNALVIQDHRGISNAAPADCPSFSLPVPMIEKASESENQVITEARIHDYICNLRFCISPTAFFQVNTLAAEKLYTLAGDWAGLNLHTLLFDICCGTGTIGLTLANRVGMVVGIEMNNFAVADAVRNADINGIRNCRFICAKAEDVIGALLKEYLHVSRHKATGSVASEDGFGSIDSIEVKEPCACMTTGSADLNKNIENSVICNVEVHDNASAPTESCGEASQDCCLCKEIEEANASTLQFKDVVVIVDPPRVGLHPIVIKALRIHPSLRRLIYISCNPESLVANAIELCTPTADNPHQGTNNRQWRNMSSAGLARHRTKSMPKSEPFRPVRAMAVDLFPHTPHCEMVMLFER